MATPAPACKKILADATARWPNRNKASDGIMGDARHRARKSDHNDGNAADVTHDPDVGCTGDAIAEAALEDSRVKYVIWNRQINSRDGRGWRKYTGKNPHTHHCHISIHASAREDTRPWGWAKGIVDPHSNTVATAKVKKAPEAKTTADPTTGIAPTRTSPVPPLPPRPIAPHTYPGMPVSLGECGHHVRMVQSQLRHRGWEIVVDGIYGPVTRRTVIRFQLRMSLLTDGVVGSRTWRALWR
jgi:hypothetical protein